MATTDKPAAAPSPTGPQAASVFPIDVAWLKPLSDIPARSLQEVLTFTAERLRAHADFLQRLAASQSPAEAWKHQAEYFQSSLESGSQEFRKLLKTAQDTAASARSRA
jgi:hypothetical protein